jgi:hypothetical protein
VKLVSALALCALAAAPLAAQDRALVVSVYGGGLFSAIPRSHVEVFGEIKGPAYRWNMAGFQRTMFDVTSSGGLSYRLPF